MQLIFLISAVVVFHGVMESPRFLYAKHRDEEGDESLCRLLGLPLEDEMVQSQKAAILAGVQLEEEDAKDSLTIGKLFKDTSETRVSTRIWLSWAIALGAPLYGGVSSELRPLAEYSRTSSFSTARPSSHLSVSTRIPFRF